MNDFDKNSLGEFKQTIKTVLELFPDIYIATIFGSASKGNHKPDSDIDVAVAGDKKLSVERKAQLYLALSNALKCDVDLIDLNQVSGTILKSALCSGEVVIKLSVPLFARILKKLWYNQADMAPHTKMIMEKQIQRFINGARNYS
jgi:uncharacterized protein